MVAFPGIFKGALEGRATQITEEMKLAAAEALADLVSDEELNDDLLCLRHLTLVLPLLSAKL